MNKGAYIKIISINKNGYIIDWNEKLCKVRYNNKVITVKISDIEIIDASPNKINQTNYTNSKRIIPKIKFIDLHGLTEEESYDRTIDFVENARLLKLNKVEIVHGISGNGATYRGMKRALQKVDAFGQNFEDQFSGNAGKTIIHISYNLNNN